MPLPSVNDRELIDATGTRHEVAGAQARIVCLVPSITELLFDLGLGAQVVGRTGFCIHPKDCVKRIVKVGGTKVIDASRIKRLALSVLCREAINEGQAEIDVFGRAAIRYVEVPTCRKELPDSSVRRFEGQSGTNVNVAADVLFGGKRRSCCN